jgi:hypothetical protein
MRSAIAIQLLLQSRTNRILALAKRAVMGRASNPARDEMAATA